MSGKSSPLAVLASGLVLLSFGLANTAKAQEGEPIRVGAPIALTGSIAGLVAEMSRGISLALDEINDGGGVLGRPFEVLYEDSRCNADAAVDAGNQLAENDEVLAFIGPVCSGATLRLSRSIAIPQGIPTLSFASASPMISRLRDDDLVFRTAVSDAEKAVSMAEIAIERGLTSMSVSFATDAYNSGIAQAFRDAYESLGGEVAVFQAHQPDQPGYTREAQALIGGADSVAVFAYYGSSGVRLIRDMKILGTIDTMIASDGMMSDETLAAIDPNRIANTIIVASGANENREGFSRWEAVAEAGDLDPRGRFVANAYDATILMALAIQAAGEAERSAVPQGLRDVSGPSGETIYPGEYAKAVQVMQTGGKVNYEGASGPVDFDDNGDISGFISLSVPDGQSGWATELLE